MKKTINIIFLFGTINCFHPVFGQELSSIGVNAGAALTTMRFSVDSDYTVPEFSYEAGLITNILFTETIGLLPSLDFARVSVLRTASDPTYDSSSGLYYWDRKYNMDYLRLSLPLSYTVIDYGDVVGFLAAGPYFSYLLNGKYNWYELSGEHTIKGNFKIGNTEDYDIKPMDYGLHLAGFAGIFIGNSDLAILLGGKIDYGLSDISPKKDSAVHTFSATLNIIITRVF